MKNRESDGMTHKAVIEELSLLNAWDGALMGNHGPAINLALREFLLGVC